MSKGAQQAGNTTQTQTTAPYMYPYIGSALGQAGNLLQAGGPNPYPGQRVANFNPAQQKAMGGIMNLGMNGTPGMTAAGNFDTTLLNSGMNNPWLNNMFQQGANQIDNNLTSQFGQAGRNAEAAQPMEGQALGNYAANLYGGQYQNTIQDALQAGNQAQNLYGAQLGGMNQALGVGNQIQQQGQNQIQASMDAYNQAQQRPYQNLGTYEQFLQGVQPGAQTQTPYFQNKGATDLGSALAAQQLYKGYQGKGTGTSGGGS